MSATIWKYPFSLDDIVVINMPAGATVLTVQAQYGQPCLWALVDPEAAKVARRFRVLGTGHPCDLRGDSRYVGTFQLSSGKLVFHLFEIH